MHLCALIDFSNLGCWVAVLFLMSQKYKDTLNLPRTDFPMKANLPLTNNPLSLDRNGCSRHGSHHRMLLIVGSLLFCATAFDFS